MSTSNPYHPSETVGSRPIASPRQITLFRAMFVFSLVMCLFRSLFTLIEIRELIFVAESDPAFRPIEIAGIVTSIAMVILGVSTNGLLLIPRGLWLQIRQRWCSRLGIGFIVATAISIGVYLWYEIFSRTMPYYRSLWINHVLFGMIVVIRIGLLAAYAFCLRHYTYWLRQQATVLKSSQIA